MEIMESAYEAVEDVYKNARSSALDSAYPNNSMSETKIIWSGKWEMDKNLDDFIVIAENLRKEGHQSRADAMYYLIERCKISEKRVSDLENEKSSLNETLAFL